MRGRTGKWTIRTIFHFFDFAAAASWLKYREYAVKEGLQSKHIQQFLSFKMDLAKYLIYGSQMLCPASSRVTRNSATQQERNTKNIPTLNRKRKLVEPVPHIAKRLKKAKHLTLFMNNERAKCRHSKCNQQTFVKCSDCNIYLCLNANRNGFFEFHNM